ncbi:hypothetical protein BHE74_00038306 [Ensete ventricosum]|nr:hypothetical protein BHE74_00038306 [Ensete ventricosum]
MLACTMVLFLPEEGRIKQGGKEEEWRRRKKGEGRGRRRREKMAEEEKWKYLDEAAAMDNGRQTVDSGSCDSAERERGRTLHDI